jgi:hypothetical protein
MAGENSERLKKKQPQPRYLLLNISMKKLILTRKQAQHLLKNIPAGKSIQISVKDADTLIPKPKQK